MEHEIRKDVWPFLLGHYKFGMSKKEMEQVREPIPMATGSWGAGPRDPREGASEGSAPLQPERNMAEEDVSRATPLSSPLGPSLVSSCPSPCRGGLGAPLPQGHVWSKNRWMQWWQ